MEHNSSFIWGRLGDYIEPYKKKCGSIDVEVSGVDINKSFISTRANLIGTDVSKYYIVPPLYFACNLMHVGRDERIPIALNDTSKDLVVTSAYFVFGIKQNMQNVVLPSFLYMFFNSTEKDRLGFFYCDSSIRGNLSISRFEDIRIPLPSIERQQELVSVWKSLKDISDENEAIAEPLEQLCKSYMQKLKHTVPMMEIGNYIKPFDNRNKEGNNLPLLGVNKDKTFIPTVANTIGLDKRKYKIIQKGEFVFSGMQTGRDKCIRISLYNEENPALLSPAYTTFSINSNVLLPEFLFMWFKRSEMDRYGWFISDSSVRSNLDWQRFVDIKIPIPSIEQQKAIVALYNCATKSKKIAKRAKQLSIDICPALMQKAIRG